MDLQELKMFAEHMKCVMQEYDRIFFVRIEGGMTGGYGNGVAALARRGGQSGQPEFQATLIFTEQYGYYYESGWKKRSVDAIDRVLELVGLPPMLDKYHPSDLRSTLLRRTKGINER
ncbi:MAG: hypothetical protein NTZ65_03130 [Candidatus Berkelbacteria bacterium]|nr:hypothetical protein [Candidatus Berkelbacteria bacterium]